MRLAALAALCLLIGFVVGSVSPIGVAFAQIFSPAAVNGCIYFSTPPTLANRQQNVFQCDVNGKLITG
jgi:hypothetical protein